MNGHLGVRVHEIAKDGLPDMDEMAGRTAFVFYGGIISGQPLHPGATDERRRGEWTSYIEFAGNGGVFSNVTHWVEFPFPIHKLPQD